MTNDLSDVKNLTENLQKMLRYLSFALPDEELRVNANGLYDDKTAGAVMKYQMRSGIPPTGVVDLSTWSRIKEDYDRERELRREVSLKPLPTDADYITRIGERSDTVALLQVVLSALRLIYEYPEVPLSGIYGSQTEDAVRAFQGKNGLNVTGIADRTTWQRLADEYNILTSQ